MAPRQLNRLKPGSLEYSEVEQAFFDNWYHLESKDTPNIQRILRVNPHRTWRRRFRVYRNDVARRRGESIIPVTKRLWHGTKWSEDCPLLKDELHPHRQNCNLCKIVTTTLKRSKKGLFGSGIYLTQTSSKADSFAGKSEIRALVLLRAVVGKAYVARRPMKHLNRAPRGHDSILGTRAKTRRPADLHYDEYTVYRRKATLPAFVVIYRIPPRRVRYPKVVALDLDGTTWKNSASHTRWGRGPGAYAKVEDNLVPATTHVVQDRSNLRNKIRLFEHIPWIANDIALVHGARLAIVSRNASKVMADRALHYFKAEDPVNGTVQSIISLVTYDEVVNESKVYHFRRILHYYKSYVSPQIDFSDMILYDDEAANNVVRIETGVTFQLVRKGEGLTWDTYQRGLKAWKRAKAITILKNPADRRPKLIGFSGLPESWIDLVRKGEGTVDLNTPYRWGYGLYVTDTFGIAQYFCSWNSKTMTDVSHVCEVWVKDYDAWTGINKVWIPENSSRLVQMHNTGWTKERTGDNQEHRDQFIAENWHVDTPYVLFSKHHWMRGIPTRGRFTEMVVYTQVQRSLFEVVPIQNSKYIQHSNPNPFPFERQVREWNIKVPRETRVEIGKYKEPKLR